MYIYTPAQKSYDTCQFLGGSSVLRLLSGSVHTSNVSYPYYSSNIVGYYLTMIDRNLYICLIEMKH